jgi:hypothetical protein
MIELGNAHNILSPERNGNFVAGCEGNLALRLRIETSGVLL